MNVGVSGTTHGRGDEIKRVNVKKHFPEDGARDMETVAR